MFSPFRSFLQAIGVLDDEDVTGVKDALYLSRTPCLESTVPGRNWSPLQYEPWAKPRHAFLNLIKLFLSSRLRVPPPSWSSLHVSILPNIPVFNWYVQGTRCNKNCEFSWFLHLQNIWSCLDFSEPEKLLEGPPLPFSSPSAPRASLQFADTHLRFDFGADVTIR